MHVYALRDAIDAEFWLWSEVKREVLNASAGCYWPATPLL